jgi:carbon monoxide dehydrogenase subunit G
MAPRKVIVKVLTVNKPASQVFEFLSDVKNMEIGGAIKSVTKGDDDWWEFDHTVAGKGKMKVTPVQNLGILDHEFVGAGLEWKVYVRVVPNGEGSTTTWTFMRPDGLTEEQFQEQLKGFDEEVNNWQKYLDEH